WIIQCPFPIPIAFLASRSRNRIISSPNNRIDRGDIGGVGHRRFHPYLLLVTGLRPQVSSTFIAALCPGIPLTAPPRWALDPQRNTFSYSVSTPHAPACLFVSAKGNVGASWKMLP